MTDEARFAPQLILFGGRRCGRTRRVEGFLSLVLQRRRNHHTFRIYRVVDEQHPELFEKFRVSRTPTLVVAHEKRVRGRLVQPSGAREIASFLGPWLR